MLRIVDFIRILAYNKKKYDSVKEQRRFAAGSQYHEVLNIKSCRNTGFFLLLWEFNEVLIPEEKISATEKYIQQDSATDIV